MELEQLEKVSDYEWEIPTSYREDMRVPVRIFATREILEGIKDDRSLEQAVNSATLPGLVGHVTVMPDMHQGYGFPIGGVAAPRYPEGVVSPGAIVIRGRDDREGRIEDHVFAILEHRVGERYRERSRHLRVRQKARDRADRREGENPDGVACAPVPVLVAGGPAREVECDD